MRNVRHVLCHGVLLAGIIILGSFFSAVHAELAGHTFTQAFTLPNFNFDPPYQDFAGITFNPITQTYFMTDNKKDAIFEMQSNGLLIRTINIAGLKTSGVTTADAEGIAWMRGQTFAIALHDGKEMAVVTIGEGVTTLARTQAVIYDVKSGPGKPKGLAYAGWEDAFYWVTKDSPKMVIKARINALSGKWETVWEKNVDTLPVANLADVALFPKLSPNLFLISESSKLIMEVDMTGATPVLKSSMSLDVLGKIEIPQAGGMTFWFDGTMAIVGKHVAVVPEDDFTTFTVSPAVTNKIPFAAITIQP